MLSRNFAPIISEDHQKVCSWNVTSIIISENGQRLRRQNVASIISTDVVQSVDKRNIGHIIASKDDERLLSRNVASIRAFEDGHIEHSLEVLSTVSSENRGSGAETLTIINFEDDKRVLS